VNVCGARRSRADTRRLKDRNIPQALAAQQTQQ
jgi:hypothetical protein